jgi:lambda family phage portal protein
MSIPKKPNLKKAVRKAVRDVKAYAKAKGLKAKADGFGGGGSGIFSQFEGAKYSNKRQWVNTPWPADQKRTMTVFDRQELTRKMRWLSVNMGLIRGLIADNVMYAVGDGIKPQAASGDANWDKLAEAYFNDWANKPCDITGRYNFWECQQLACRKVDVDGEIFVLKTFGTDGKTPKIQLIESHRVGTSASLLGSPVDGVWDGVMFNKWGAVVGYQVIRSDGTTRLIGSNSMLHIYHPEQVSGARAYSPLQHSILNCIDILEVISLEKTAMKVGSDIVRTITRENPQFDGSTADFEAFGMRPQDYPTEVYNNPEQVGSFIGGKTLSLAPGEDLKMVESGRPSPNVIQAIEYLERDSTAGVLPYAFTANPEKASGSAIRLVVSKAERYFNARQHMLMTRFLTPIYAYITGSAIANGDLPPNDNWAKVNWVTPRRVTVDAGREAAANQRDIEMGLKTLSDHFAELGMDPREEIRRRASDARLVIDTAKEFDVPVSMIYQPSSNPQTDIDQTITTHDNPAQTASASFKPMFGEQPPQ